MSEHIASSTEVSKGALKMVTCIDISRCMTARNMENLHRQSWLPIKDNAEFNWIQTAG